MIRIGVLGTASIAERRMIPAILKCPGVEYAGVAIATREETGTDCTEEEFLPVRLRKEEKARAFVSKFGGEAVTGYENMLRRPDIDAVYIPLPPALHFRWILLALQYGKHVISEKPLTISREQSESVIREAEARGLALIENYGFCYHRQMKLIREVIDSGRIGELRLVRAAFCFPHREESDFRYSKALGGGALLDCGGYTVKAATAILGSHTEVVCSELTVTPGHEVDIYGSATVRNEDGLCAQLFFGMDNAYICELEISGSTGSITASRAYTAPDGFKAPVIIRSGNDTQEAAETDDQFEAVIREFTDCVEDDNRRKAEYESMLLQSALVERISEGAGSVRKGIHSDV